MSFSFRSVHSSPGMVISRCSPSSYSLRTNATSTSLSTCTTTHSSGFPYSNLRSEASFKVLIVGAGIGGLMMGYCLERAGIDFVILERDRELPTPKSTIQLTSNTLYLMEQLGLLDEILKIAKPASFITLLRHDMSAVGKLDCLHVKDRHGYYSYMVQRREFCELLISRMAPGRICWGRKVLEVVNGNGGVQCRCANSHVEQGDVLVGADGAHSAVRQNLYKTLKDKKNFSKTDLDSPKFTQNAIMGTTVPMDLNRYPEAGTEFSEVYVVVGKGSPYTMWITPSPGNRISWCVTGPMLTANPESENFMVSSFGPEEAERACDSVRHLKIPYGGTLGDLIDLTTPDCLTKILVEEKYYETWYHGRTVLIGEACHKFVSFSGQGAEQAILDAVALVNLFYKIERPYPLSEITAAFETYHRQRLPATKAAVRCSGQVAKLTNSQGWGADVRRKMLFNLPTWVQASSIDKVQVRPQLDCLPQVEHRGSKSVHSLPLSNISW